MMNSSDRSDIHGYVSAGFESVRESFISNFERHHESGGACCAFLRGEKVVLLGSIKPVSSKPQALNCNASSWLLLV
jgi:hypothetical protein